LEQAYDKARDEILERSGQQSDFFPALSHPIAVATLQADADYRITRWGAGCRPLSRSELVSRFWQVFENSETLVTFNGRGFDLPVMEIQALKHCLSLPRYFAAGQSRQTYRGSRYSDTFHMDLCDFLANFGAALRRGSSTCCPDSQGCRESTRLQAKSRVSVSQKRLKEINQYCMTDVLQRSCSSSASNCCGANLTRQATVAMAQPAKT